MKKYYILTMTDGSKSLKNVTTISYKNEQGLNASANTIYGTFLIFAEEINDEIVDIIIGEKVMNASFQKENFHKPVCGLGYYSKAEVQASFVLEKLNSLSDDDIKRYYTAMQEKKADAIDEYNKYIEKLRASQNIENNASAEIDNFKLRHRI